MATMTLYVNIEREDLKKFFNMTSAISQEFDALTKSKSFRRLIFTEATKYFGSTKWPMYGLTKDEFEDEVKDEIRAIATKKGVEFFLKEGSLMVVKPVIASSVNETTAMQAVMNVCNSKMETLS